MARERAYTAAASTMDLVDVSALALGSVVIGAQGSQLEAFLRGRKEGV